MNANSLEDRRTWIAGGIAVALVLLAASWFLLIQPKLNSADDARTAASANEFANTQLIVKHNKLAQQERGIKALRAKLTAALQALPATSALPEFTKEVTKTASETSVTLTNIAIGALAPVVPAVTANAAATTPTPSAPSTTAQSTSPAPASSGSAGSAPAQQYQVSVTLSSTGLLKNQLAFLKAVENGSRRALVTSTSFSGDGSKTSVTTQLNIFTAPMSAEQIAQLRKLLTTG